MYDAKLEKKLDRTHSTISNHIARGGSNSQTSKSWELQDRYDKLKEQAQNKDAWFAYCTTRGFSVEHRAWDLWA
jgi:hypothetical protein